MHQTSPSLHARPSQVRFTPVLNLTSGEPMTLLAETLKPFEERVAFGPAASESEPVSPAAFLAEQLLQIARMAHEETDIRPVIVPISMAALIHADTPIACDAAIRRTVLCPQEICFEVNDSTLALPSPEARQGLMALRKLGFRLSLDATRSWQAALSTDLRILLETMRIDSRQIELEPALEERIETASTCGMQIIAEQASWRDGDWLASMGIDYGVRPRADA